MSLATKKNFTLEEYHRLMELGFFQEDDRVELIRGEIVQMAAKGMAHTVCCSNLVESLVLLISGKAKLRVQDPIILPSGSEPEPDLTIVKNREDNYIIGHPTPADIILVIEIADSSLNYDKQVKLPLYAEAGIQYFWLFNLPENQLEAYSQPYPKMTGQFDYSQRQIFLPTQTIDLPEFFNLTLDLSKIFPLV